MNNNMRILFCLTGALAVISGNACDNNLSKNLLEMESPYSFETLATFLQENQHNPSIVLIKGEKNISHWSEVPFMALHIFNSPDVEVKHPLTRNEITEIDICNIAATKNTDGSHGYSITKRRNHSGPLDMMSFALDYVPDSFFESAVIDGLDLPSYDKFTAMLPILKLKEKSSEVSRRMLLLSAIFKLHVLSINSKNVNPFKEEYIEKLAKEALNTFNNIINDGSEQSGKLLYVVARYFQLSLVPVNHQAKLQALKNLKNECSQGVSSRFQKAINEQLKSFEEYIMEEERRAGIRTRNTALGGAPHQNGNSRNRCNIM